MNKKTNQNAVIQIRITQEQKKLWQTAASNAEVTLSDLIKKHVNNAIITSQLI